MQQELDLFRFRFLRENADSRDDFLRENDLNYEPISDKVKMELTSELRAAAGSKSGVIEIYEYFKVSICCSSYHVSYMKMVILGLLTSISVQRKNLLLLLWTVGKC